MRIATFHISIFHRLAISLLLVMVVLASIVGYRAVVEGRLQEHPSVGNVWKLTPGDRLIYDLKYRSDSYSDLQALYRSAGGAAERDVQRVSPHAYRVTVDATAVMTAIQRNGAHIVVGYRFPNALINAESELGNLIDADRVQLELARDTFCEIDEDGRIGSLLFDPNQSSATTNFVRALLGQMQFARPAEAAADHWEIEEDDSSGDYRAEYTATPASPASDGHEQTSVRPFHKTKLEYFNSAGDDDRELPEAPKTIMPESAFDLTFDFDKGRLEKIAGREAQTIIVAGKIVGGIQSEFELRLLDELKASDVELASAAEDQSIRRLSTQAVSLSPATSERAQIAAIYSAQLGEDSLDTLKAALDEVEHGSSRIGYSRLYSKVKALIFLHPSECAQLGTVLRHSDSGGPVAQLVVGALAAVGSAEAQDALIETIAARRGDPAAVQPPLIALASVKNPTRSAQDAVEELAWTIPESAIAKAAQLVLGAMAHNLRRRSPQRAAAIIEHASIRLLPITGSETQLIALLGNSGVAEALPVLEKFMVDPSAELRGRTALALRFIEGDAADEHLARLMTSDPDESVRLQAANALEFRSTTQTNVDAQTAALRSDASSAVRLRVMNNLWLGRHDYPDVIPLMERMATSDPSKEVRSSAAKLLGSR